MGVSAAVLSLILHWDQLPDDVPFVQDAHNFHYIEKETLIELCIFSAIVHIGIGILSRFPERLLPPGIITIITDQNREVQLKIVLQFCNSVRIQIVLMLNGIIIGTIAVALNSTKGIYVWCFQQGLTVVFLITWIIYLYRAYHNR